MKKRLRKLVIAIAAAVVLCGGVLCIYAADYYRADETAEKALKSTETVSVETTGGMAVFCPENAEAGFIFYPGGKVEYTAYAPLMHSLAENNIACIITKMPFNLAVMDINAADKAYERIADIDRWYIGGHSLGGSMAAAYLDKTENNFEGIVLLASYSIADLTDNSVEVLSLYGSNDGVLNMESYRENFPNLPENTAEIIIDGGNHARFGSYGVQKGDGEAVISAEEQLAFTADAMISFIKE